MASAQSSGLRAFIRDEENLRLIKFWLPSLLSAGLVWLLLLYIGQTPLSRATGLALVIMGVTLALRRMGSALSVVGGLALAFSPAFWAQTGGGQGEPAAIVIAAGVAAVFVLLVALLSKRPYIGIGIGILVFVAYFFSQTDTVHSIRLTAFVVGWLMFLLIDMLLLTNPRPDEAPMLLKDGKLQNAAGAEDARPYHTLGILLLLAVGILNDPLLTLLMPSMALSLLLTKTKLHWAYWLGFGLVAGFGLRGIWADYLVAQEFKLALDSWRNGVEWLDMIQLVVAQFSIVGVVLSVLGLARLARWYPPLGTVTLLAFAAYWGFGLVFNGPQRDSLLLPLYVIQLLWMNYAVLAISEWAAKILPNYPNLGRYLVIAAYSVLPIALFIGILGQKA
jgi:hypothetical protein